MESVTALARAMHAEAPVYRSYAFDPERVRGLCLNCLNVPEWVCFVAEGDDGSVIGFTAGVLVPTIFGPNTFVEDVGFYVHPAWRGTSAAVRMVRMLEGWAQIMGASALRIGVTTGTNPGPTGRFLSRFGYDLTGWLYTKPC